MSISWRNIQIPHVFIFLSAIILFSAILTYMVPSGEFERATRQTGNVTQTVVIPGSYQALPKHFSLKGLILGDQVPGKASPTSLLGLFTSIPKGMNQSAALIFFVFIIGAVFNLIRHTGTIHVFVYRLMRRFQHRPALLVFSIYMVLSLASTFLGIGTEFMPLIPLFLIIAKKNGYDRIFGLSMLLLPFVIGWATALTNPFTVQIAQQIAEVPIGSGIGLRLVLFLTSSALGFSYLILYGRKVRATPGRSHMREDPFVLEEDGDEDLPLESRHIWIIVTALILLGMILFAVQTMGWGLIEMSGGFFMVGLMTILISGMTGNEAMKAFVKGLEVMIIPALVVGFARGIQVVIQEAKILDSMLFYTANLLEQLPTMLAVEGMFVFQSFLNFFIPSASGQALVSMPLMVPLSDLLEISRQTTVLAYQLGDGLSNMIVPTSGVLMAMLGLAGVPYDRWFRFVWPLFLILCLVGFIFLAAAVWIGY